MTRFGLILMLLSFWLGWSILTDFVVVPTTFKTIHDFFNAGELGMGLFMQLNCLEFVVGCSLFSLFAIEISKKHKLYVTFSLLLICLTIVSTYLFYLTPKLIHLTQLWKSADTQGLALIKNIGDIQQEHQFFHQIYIKLDTLKIFLLSCITFLHIRSVEKWY